MKNERIFYKCDKCGNLAELIHSSGVNPVCCGQLMTLLVPNTTDAAVEKHVPVITRDGDKVNISIGAVIHPMLPEHYIEWIVLAQGETTKRVALNPGDEPVAVFCAGEGVVTAYAYCNIHGLWASEA